MTTNSYSLINFCNDFSGIVGNIFICKCFNKYIVKKGLNLFKLDRSGLSLVESIKPYDHVLIIDAIKPDATQPSFICLDAHQLISTSSQISSHETGLIETVTLLKSLQMLPQQFVVAGVSNIKNEVIEQIINLF